MKIFDFLLLDLTIIMMPLLIYIIYVAYVKTIDKKENNLIFIITILSQVYLIIKYGHAFYKGVPLLIIDIPLILSYSRKSKLLIIILSVISLLYYYNYYNNYILFTLIAEYIIYYLLSRKINSNYTFITAFSIIKTIFLSVVKRAVATNVIMSGLILYMISIFVIYTYSKTKDMFELHKSIKEIENDKQIKTSLFKITHEIKNPIAVCKGYLDMYDENKIDKFKKHIPILKEEIDRTLILLEDFLAMNKLKIKKDILDINLLLEEVTNNMQLLFKQNKIKVDSKISEDEVYINGDYNRLTQVFINIFKNSIEAMQEKKKRIIKIWTRINDDKIIIFIEDNGVGISEKEMSKIKEPFYTTKEKGTGLGVSLSNEIIKAHKGELLYESEKEKYTKVTIILPLEKAI